MNFRIIAIALLATHLEWVYAAIDCSILQGDVIRNLGQCCRKPKPDLNAFSRQCPNLADRFRTSNLERVECLFNASDIIKDEELQLDNTRKMVNTIYPNDPEFVNAVVVSFDKCQPIVKARAAKIRARRPTIAAPQPSVITSKMFVIGYMVCAGQQLLVNCPSASWMSSNKCEKTREFMTNCKPMIRTGNSSLRDGRLR